MLEQNGTESKMTIAYLKDVSSLLALVVAVRDCNFELHFFFELHLQAEREMIKHYFAFDHVNYARYLAYQQVYLRDLERKDHPAINDLKTRGFGCSISDGNFSTLHGDLITEIFNGQNIKLVHIEQVSVQIWIRTTLCQTSCGINEENKDEYMFNSQRINTIRHSFTFDTC